MTQRATARSCSNIAFIKYWGTRDNRLRLPSNGSISMNLGGLETVTTVSFAPEYDSDQLNLNGHAIKGIAAERVSQHLDRMRALAGRDQRARVISTNSFPAGAGLASSASAFSALTLAGCAALELALPERALSSLARLGSGSACRSIPGGFVEWHAGDDHESSYAESIADADHWNIVDLVALVSDEHKAVGSTAGHAAADTSPLQAARLEGADRRLSACREAILNQDFESFARIIEQDSLLMHAVMITSQPSLIYWTAHTLDVIHSVRSWREDGLPVGFTIDAGPNVHVMTTADHREAVVSALREIDGVQDILIAAPGGPARLLDEHLPDEGGVLD
jgi:diphosphomevalonate decarboxylase